VGAAIEAVENRRVGLGRLNPEEAQEKRSSHCNDIPNLFLTKEVREGKL